MYRVFYEEPVTIGASTTLRISSVSVEGDAFDAVRSKIDEGKQLIELVDKDRKKWVPASRIVHIARMPAE